MFRKFESHSPVLKTRYSRVILDYAKLIELLALGDELLFVRHLGCFDLESERDRDGRISGDEVAIRSTKAICEGVLLPEMMMEFGRWQSNSHNQADPTFDR